MTVFYSLTALGGFRAHSKNTSNSRYQLTQATGMRQQWWKNNRTIQEANSTRSTKSKLRYDRRSIGQSVLEWSTRSWLTTRFVLLSGSCGHFYVRRSRWREVGSAVYNCCWSSPAQSSCVRVPWDTWTYLLPQIGDSPNLEGQVLCLYLSGTGWPSYIPGTGFPFRSLPRLAGLR
jgi:hypothetical protein